MLPQRSRSHAQDALNFFRLLFGVKLIEDSASWYLMSLEALYSVLLIKPCIIIASDGIRRWKAAFNSKFKIQKSKNPVLIFFLQAPIIRNKVLQFHFAIPICCPLVMPTKEASQANLKFKR